MKCVCTIMLYSVVALAQGQVMQIGLLTGTCFYPSTGTDRWMLGKNGSTFDRFAASYNELNAAGLTNSLGPLRMRPSIYAGINAVIGAFYSEVVYNTIHGQTRAEFANGNVRHIDVKCKDVDVGIGFGIHTEVMYLCITGTMVFGFGDRLTAWTVYPDGTESFGDENFLNGIYTTPARVNFKPGLRLGINAGHGLTLTVAMDKLKEGNEYAYYNDMFAGEVETELVNSDPSNIGTDWGSYLASPADYILSDSELVRSGWSGLQVRIGLAINLFFED